MLIVFLIGILLWISIIDIRKQIIPDKVLLLAVGVRVIYFLCYEGFCWQGLWMLCMEGLIVSVPLLVITLGIERFFQKELLGGGDIKLLFVTGMYLGWERNLWAFLFACILGIGIGMIKKEGTYFPFGPAITVGVLLAIFI